MKKTKLLTSIAALALVVGLGACEVYVDVGDVDVGVDVNPNDSSEPDEGGTTDSDSEPGDDEGSNPGVDPNPGTGEGGGSTETTTLSNYTLSIGIQYGGQLVEVPEYAAAYIQGSWDSWTNWVALTPNNSRYEYTFDTIGVDTYEYQLVLAYNDGEPGWTYRITQDGDNASFTVNGSEGDDYKNEVTVTSSKALSEIIPDPNAALSNVTVTFDITYGGVSQGILDYGTLWIEGSWDWSEGFVACTVEDGKYVYTFDSLAPIEYEFLGVIYYSDEDLPTEAEGLWSYKVNGSDNCKFTVSDASVSATLVAAQPLAEILPEKGGDEGEDDDAVIAEAILDAVNEGISWDAFHGEYIDEGYDERETVYLTEDEDGIYGSIIDSEDDEVTFAYYYQDGKDYEYAANSNTYNVFDQSEEYRGQLDEYIEEQLDVAEDFDLDSDTYELKEHGDGYELIFTTDFMGYYEYEYIYIVDEDFDVTALAYGEYFAGDLEGWYAEETTYDKVVTSMADFDPTLWAEEEEETEPLTGLLGFEYEGINYYIDGTMFPSYNYEGNITDNIDEAIEVTATETEGDNAYYLTFELNNITYYVCIIVLDNGYTDLQYTTEPNAIYYDASLDGWVNDSGTYFLCYNSAYKCFYASKIEEYGPSGSKGTSPIAHLYEYPTIEGITLSADSTEVAETQSLRIDVTYTPSTIGASNLEWESSSEDVATVDGGVVTGVAEGEVTITATTLNGLTATIDITVVAYEAPDNLVGTLDFSAWCTANANANTAFSTTTLGNCLTASYTGTGTITAGDTSSAYPASNGSGDGLKGSTDCIQIGASNSTGYFTFTVSSDVSRVVVKAVNYDSSAHNLKVNDVSTSVPYLSTSYDTWDSVPTIEYTIDAATTITLASVTASSGRILVHSIELYSA